MLTRNHSEFISQAIVSVQSQSVQQWELLIGEDCSNDDTASLVHNASQSDPRISVFSSPDGPLGFHRNFARLLNAARAPYVAFLEGDDWWCNPRKLELQLLLLDSDSTLALCGGYTTPIDYRLESEGFVLPTIGPGLNFNRLSLSDLIQSYSFHFSSVVIRRQFVSLPDWIFSQYCLDRPLYLLAARHGDAGVIHSALSVYRLHSGGVWAPLLALEKAKRSRLLFKSFCSHFDPSLSALFRVTLSHILWSYLAEAFREKRSIHALQIIWMAIRASPRLRLYSEPRLTLSALFRAVNVSRHIF